MTPQRLAGLVAILLAVPSGRAQSVLGTVAGSVPYDNVGLEVALLGDLNADGHDELAIGSGGGAAEPGVVAVLSGADLSELFELTGEHGGDAASVPARLGDLDGDGVPDLAVGARGDDTGGPNAGRVTLHSGATGALLHALVGPEPGGQSGWSVAGAGDVDGDGLDDLLVGAPGGSVPARVRLYSSATWSPVLDLPGDGTTLGLGRVVASIDDLDGDGRRDVLVGLEGSNRVRIHSSADGTILLQVSGPPGGKLGRSVASVGDIDGDGLEDLAAGAPELDTFGLPSAGADAGFVQVHSSATGELLFAFQGARGGDQLGHEVAAAGDVDGDGVPDVLASAPYHAWSNPAEPGGVVLALGGATGKPLGTLGSAPGTVGFGLALAGGGDVNADGHPDLVVGAPSVDTPTEDAGLLTCASFRFRVRDAYPDRLLFSDPGVVTLFGGGFEAGSPIGITVGGAPASGVTWVSEGLVSFTAPAGTEDSLADLVVTQDGLDVVVPAAFTYEGVRLVDITPDSSPMAGGSPVTLWGEHFVDDGSTTVTFLAGPGTITNIDAPNRIDVTPPAYTPPGTHWDVHVASSNGTFDYYGFVYQNQSCIPERGNITGGLPVTIFGVPGHLLENTTVTMGSGGPPCPVTAVTLKQIHIVTPPIAEPTGQKSSLAILDPVAGNEVLPSQFLYTPWMEATFEGNGFHGGTLSLRWVTDPAVAGTQLITVWMGNLLGPSVQKTLPGFAGVLRELPYSFLLVGLPEPPQPQLLRFHVPPLDPSLTGLHLRFQSLVSGEGGPKGTFSNVTEVVLP
jgi:hypothetical protein